MLSNTEKIKIAAFKLGFSYIGISKVEFLDKEAKRLESWLNSGQHGKMSYMENYFDLRTNPKLLVDDAKSVISVLFNYYTDVSQKDKTAPIISKYALGKDYHLIMREKLNSLYKFILDEIGEVNGRGFVDSAPVMDKAWAVKSGLGWMGKHSNLINKEQGSYFFIGELILDLDLEANYPIKDFCGTCTLCIDACPTDAIIAPYQVDGSKCISYLTIELKDDLLPKEFADKMDNRMFGCDICQEVCPWNIKFEQVKKDQQFQPRESLVQFFKNDWKNLNQSNFKSGFSNSAVKRTKYNGLKRNIESL